MKKRSAICFAAVILLLLSGVCGTANAACVHNMVFVKKETATCKMNGYYLYRCTLCGQENKDIIYSATVPHTWKDVKIYTEATCVSQGEVNSECKVCGLPQRRVIPPNDNHDWKQTSKAASTCTKNGSASYVCNLCGKSETRTLAKSEHSYGTWKIQKEATDCTMGRRSHTCKNCGYTVTEDYYPEGTMYRGGDNDVQAVVKYQTMLTELGYAVGEIDGVFGRQTKQITADFQTKAGITSDGIAWPQTIQLVTEAWEKLSKMPVVTPAPTEVPKKEPDYPYCRIVVDEQGSSNVVYCAEHEAVIELCDVLMDSANTESARARAALRCRGLWEDELELLYEMWANGVQTEEDSQTLLKSQTAFNLYCMQQEMLYTQWKNYTQAQFDEHISKLTMEQCGKICGIVYDMNIDKAGTQDGTISVKLVDGWEQTEAGNDFSVALQKKLPVGSAWITMEVNRRGFNINQAKDFVLLTYPGRAFEKRIIGTIEFELISNEIGNVFTLITSTSDKSVVLVEGRGCTLEQTAALLETVSVR